MINKITPTAYAAHRKQLGLPGTSRQAVQKAIATCRLLDCVVDGEGRNHSNKDFDNEGRKYISSSDDADIEWASKTTRAPRNNPLSIDGTGVDQSSNSEKPISAKTKKDKKSEKSKTNKTTNNESEQKQSKQIEFQDHKTRREDAQASLAEFELAQKKGQLISTPELVNVLVIIASELQRNLIKLPDSICDDLASDNNPQKIRVKLRNAITLALTESAESMKKILPKKDQNAITQQVEIKL